MLTPCEIYFPVRPSTMCKILSMLEVRENYITIFWFRVVHLVKVIRCAFPALILAAGRVLAS